MLANFASRHFALPCHRRTSLLFRAFLLSATLAAAPSHAQTFPTKDIQFVTPGSPGSTSDIMPRVLAEEMQKSLGRSVVVVNRAGGSGLNAAVSALAMPADGHAIYLGTMGTLTINPFVLPSMPFDALKAWTPVALVASMPLVLVVHPETPVDDLAGLVATARAQPGKLTYGSAGAGSSMAITAAVLGKQAGVEFTHVPYKGILEGVSAVLGREITMMVPDVGAVSARLKEGRLKALGVTTAARSSLLPDVRTMKEQGFDMDISLWYGVFVRSETLRPVVDRLVAELRSALATANVKSRWLQMELTVGDKLGADFETFYAAEYKRWGDSIQALGLKIQ